MSFQVYSQYSSVLNVNGVGNFPWLKNTLDPTMNMELEIFGKEFKFGADMGQGSFDAIGRKIAITVTDTESGEEFDFDVALPLYEDNVAFELFWTTKGTYLLQLPDGRQWYVNLQKRTYTLPPGTGEYAEVAVKAIEADEPV